MLAEVLAVLPDADLFALVDFLPDEFRSYLGGKRVRTSFLQRMPLASSHFRWMLPAFPAAVGSLDLSGYSRVVSISHAVAKNVKVHPGQAHFCYCLTPMRYAWDLREDYLASVGATRGPRRWLADPLLDRLKTWDRDAAARVTRFGAISHYIRQRIERAYGREATVIYPPVDVDYFQPGSASAPRDYYLTGGQWVPYKRVDAIVAAFRSLGRRLIVTGTGPESSRIRRAAGPGAQFVGEVSRDELRRLLRGARAFVFAAEEDFGILPVEAQACGTPVIALARGGTAETVVAHGDARTGVLFDTQDPTVIAAAVLSFEALAKPIDPMACRANAQRFASQRFRDEFRRWLATAEQTSATEIA